MRGQTCFPAAVRRCTTFFLVPLALWLATGCNKQLELMSDAPNPGEIPPTDPHNMALFYQIGTEQADDVDAFFADLSRIIAAARNALREAV